MGGRKMPIEIKYQEVMISSIIEHFTRSLKSNEGKIVGCHKYFIDPVKETAVLKLYIEIEEPKPKEPE
jgi:hypothetical protein